MAPRLIKLDQGKRTITIDGLVIENRLIFEFIDKQPDKERSQLLVRAIGIGVMALMEDRLAAFLSKTTNELGTELESLKYIFELNQEIFFRTTGKGRQAEIDIVSNLEAHISQSGLRDRVEHVGEVEGDLPGNKTGDIVTFVDGRDDLKIVIESKFDKAKRLGELRTKDRYTKGDTALGQLLEASVNRGAAESIIVFDAQIVDAKLQSEVGVARYFEGIGFVCIVDSGRGDYLPLFLCYDLARGLAKSRDGTRKVDYSIFSQLVGRLCADLDLFLTLKRSLATAIKQNQDMLATVHKATIALEFTKDYLTRFLEDGELSKEDLLKYYAGEEVREKFKEISKSIKEICD